MNRLNSDYIKRRSNDPTGFKAFAVVITVLVGIGGLATCAVRGVVSATGSLTQSKTPVP